MNRIVETTSEPSAYRIGAGITSYRGDFRSSALDISGDSSIKSERRQTTSYFIRVVEDVDAFDRLMKIDMSASIRSGWSEASARMELRRSISADRSSVLILVAAQEFTEQFYVDNPRLGSEAEALLVRMAEGQAEARRSFLQQFGDSFVSEVLYGAELFAVLRAEFSVVEEQEDLRSEAEGAAAGMVSGSAELVQSVKKLRSSKKWTIALHQSGMKEVKNPNLEELISYVENFRLTIDRPGFALEHDTTPYAYARRLGEEPPSFLPATEAIEDALAAQLELREHFHRISAMKKYENSLSDGMRSDISAALESIKDSEIKVGNFIKDIDRNPYLSEYDFPTYELPELDGVDPPSVADLIEFKLIITVSSTPDDMRDFMGLKITAVPNASDPISRISASIINPISGLQVETRVLQYSNLPTAGKREAPVDHGWSVGQLVGEPRGWITAVAFRLTGPLSRWFSISYKVHPFRGAAVLARDGEMIGGNLNRREYQSEKKKHLARAISVEIKRKGRSGLGTER